jgi:hypothetical protein
MKKLTWRGAHPKGIVANQTEFQGLAIRKCVVREAWGFFLLIEVIRFLEKTRVVLKIFFISRHRHRSFNHDSSVM